MSVIEWLCCGAASDKRERTSEERGAALDTEGLIASPASSIRSSLRAEPHNRAQQIKVTLQRIVTTIPR
jgi:hypothetical protein